MDDERLAGRTPDRRDFPIGIFGLPRSGGEVDDRPNAGDFPWRVTNGYLKGVKPVQ
jgi:hypothetical protein